MCSPDWFFSFALLRALGLFRIPKDYFYTRENVSARRGGGCWGEEGGTVLYRWGGQLAGLTPVKHQLPARGITQTRLLPSYACWAGKEQIWVS